MQDNLTQLSPQNREIVVSSVKAGPGITVYGGLGLSYFSTNHSNAQRFVEIESQSLNLTLLFSENTTFVR